MPNLLTKNLFYHKQQNANKGNDDSSNTRNHGSLASLSSHHTNSNASSASPPPHHNVHPHLRPSKSFLGLLNLNRSNDSLNVENSADSLMAHSSTENFYSKDNINNNNLGHANYTTSPPPQNINLKNGLSPKTSHSMLELKRFFKPTLKHKQFHSIHPHPQQHLQPQNQNTLLSSKVSLSSFFQSGNNTHSKVLSPENQAHQSVLSLNNPINVYHDDSILVQKYGTLGKTLGSGAGGSVKILVRPTDNAVFAVKEFRPRKSNESVKEYAKKCTAEFLVGSSLRHPNIVETMDIFSDSKQNKYFEVMEYLPVDFFAVVMSGKMSRNEVTCCFKQLVHGVNYLHEMGLSHRDLKLDNCCMNEMGILKLIDFGSAVVFRYPFDSTIHLAHGIVGSDPYLAPEVLASTNSYDPRFVDIWSIGIIFCCMLLKRFPWKAPKESDENYRLFSMEDDMEHDYLESARNHEKLLEERKEKKRQALINAKLDNLSLQGDNPDNSDPVDNKKEAVVDEEDASQHSKKVQDNDKKADDKRHRHQHHRHHEKSTIQGPYRLLRLLPHASRPIMSRILEIDPTQRATMKDIYSDRWFETISDCKMDINTKTVTRSDNHHHTIVKDENGKTSMYKV
ncbi:hypothetical protein KAFR_0B03170 [Kazachstania africana CBS 2517]|uniref:non-specific serine/threonine protein kinase n=1 Tax=Kazachstania africana (strain ATCC 22294 / BCRC 22015 / CBS 2517 / CECT 1963 / NBRC 1671 / NRRL Y-8276) TaxID=1071382 RepID=H2AQG3_KAZAF|nr:hypothetical protein KAFR_0B03170 [Kazachstania africana CBS 2517]CCF56613.1 hypothetical protein KAFR_0B03170 [Kazachstania africana CBS 2517]